MDIVDKVIAILAERGSARYGSESGVDVLQHSLQCAALAEREGAPPTLVAAALLHDIGHLLHDDERAAHRGIDMRHEALAEVFLDEHFVPATVQAVRLHVDAKRYLCATEPDYAAKLSAGSALTLEVQGGPYAPAEAAAFEGRPHARDAVRLRRWDEQAKVRGLATPPLDHFRRHLQQSRK